MDYNQIEHDRYMESDYEILKGCFVNLLSLLLLILALLICILCSSCTTTRYVPVVEHSTDTVQITKHQRDSIWLHDSIYMHEYQKGDTIFVESRKWLTKYVYKAVHDTTYIATHDTIPQPYPVEVEVEKELSWWQQTRLHLANIVLWVLLICGIVYGVKLYLRKKIM